MTNHLLPIRKIIRQIHPQVWLILLIAAFFIIASTLNPYQAQQTDPSTTPAIQSTGTLSSPDPNEILRNREQTNGIVAGGIILVLIIVGGTLSVIRQKKTPA
jgi:hypothetical protein